MKKFYLAFFDYQYRKDHPLYDGKSVFNYVKVVLATDRQEAKKKIGIHLSEYAETEKLIITNLTIEETEIVE